MDGLASNFECFVVGGMNLAVELRAAGHWSAAVPTALARSDDVCVVVRCSSLRRHCRALVELCTSESTGTEAVQRIGHLSTHSTSVSCMVRKRDTTEAPHGAICIRITEQPTPTALIAAENLFDAYVSCLRTGFLKEYEAYLERYFPEPQPPSADAMVSDSRPHSQAPPLALSEIEMWLKTNMDKVVPAQGGQAGARAAGGDGQPLAIEGGPAGRVSESELKDFTALSRCRMPWHQAAAHARTDQVGGLVFSVEGIRGLDLNSDRKQYEESLDFLASSRHGISSLQLS